MGAIPAFLSQQMWWEQLTRGAAGVLPCSGHLAPGGQPGRAVVMGRDAAVGMLLLLVSFTVIWETRPCCGEEAQQELTAY